MLSTGQFENNCDQFKIEIYSDQKHKFVFGAIKLE